MPVWVWTIIMITFCFCNYLLHSSQSVNDVIIQCFVKNHHFLFMENLYNAHLISWHEICILFKGKIKFVFIKRCRREKMKAIVKGTKGIKGVFLENIEDIKLKPHEIKIKVEAVGVCGTDLHIIRDEYPHELPIVLGHEFSGYIDEIGENVTQYGRGDRVVSLTAGVMCGKCSYCRRGIIMLCSERKSIGSGVNGAMAQYLKVPEKNILLIPENASMDAATLTEPLACVVRGLMERSTIKASDSVLISGCGTIGLLALQIANNHGASVIMAGTSNDAAKLEVAKKLGANAVVNIEKESKNELLDLNKGEFDIAIECAGVQSSLDNCISVVKKQGLLIQLGLFGRKVLVDLDLMLMKEIDYRNTFATTHTSWELALKLMEQNKVDLELLITDKFKMSDWKSALNTSFQKQGIKTVIYPNQ